MDREENTEYFAGVDLGSEFIKAVVMKGKAVIGSHISSVVGSYETLAEETLGEALLKGNVSAESLGKIVTTGYGRHGFPVPHLKVSPLSANAKGIHCMLSNVRTVIDMGMQQSSVVRLNDQGDAVDNVVTEKCAAGSGWLLKVVARIMGIGLEEIGPLSLRAQEIVNITTDCAVFAETEVISRISEGIPKEDILAGVHRALALMIRSQVERIGLEEECALIGGGAKDIGLVKSLSEILDVNVKVPEEPQLTSAIGAVLFHS